jgi:hypothetical protein
MVDILGGLAVIGAFITNKLDGTHDPINTPSSGKKITSHQHNIYNSSELQNTRNQLQILADTKWNDALEPINTNVIPKYFNRTSNKSNLTCGQQTTEMHCGDGDSTFSDNVSNASENSTQSDNRPLYDKGLDITRANRKIEQFTNGPPKKDTFANQFTPLSFDNPTDPIASNKPPHHAGNLSRLTIERNLNLQNGFSSLENDMTYSVVPSSQMTHNNMQPDFRPKKGYGFDIDEHNHVNDISQRKTDLFTGSLKNLDYRPKTERKPLFNPLIGLTHIYGAPVMTSEFESRFIPSREKRNEKPFQEAKVTPGLNIGYNEIGIQGYHDPYRAFTKTVNELRTPSHAKITYTTPVIHQLKGARQPTVPVVPKRRPLTFEEWGTKRMLPQFNSEITAPTIYGEYNPNNIATVNRGTIERVNYGPSQFTYTLSTPDSMYPLVHDSTKESFEYDGPRNIAEVQSQQARGATESWNAPMTQRMQPNEYIGPAFHQNSNKMYAFNSLDNVPDPNMRDIHNEPDRVGFVGQSQYYKPQAFDNYNATPDPNMRNVHSEPDRAGFVNQSQYNKPQLFDSYNATPDPNMRNVHSEPDRAGFVGQPQYNKPQAFDNYNATPDPNMRNIHSEPDRAGFVNQSQYNKPQVFDAYNATPDPNMRNIHSEPDRAGFVNQSQYNKPQVFDAYNATPDPNMRNIHSEPDRAGFVNQSQYNKPQVFDAYNATPDPNMRNIHSEPDRAGFVGQSQYAKPQAFDNYNATPDPNMRNIHSEYDRAGFVGQSQYAKPQAFDNYNATPDPNMRNIHSEYDRAGFVGQSQYAKPQAFDNYNAVPDLTFREIHIDNNHTGPIFYHESQTSRSDVKNAYINVSKEQLLTRHAPTTCNYNKIPNMEGTVVQMCEPIQINRDLYPDIKQQITPKMHTTYTRTSHSLPNDEWRFNTYVTDNLQNNPYINNTQHKSV